MPTKEFEDRIKNTQPEVIINDWKGQCGMTHYCPIYEKFKQMAKEIKQLKRENTSLKKELAYYADPNNWTRRDAVFWESIDREDCKDYPHVLRDVRLTGGHRAREWFKKFKLRYQDFLGRRVISRKV